MNPVAAELAQRHCQPLEGHVAMADIDVQVHLAALPAWARQGDAIERRCTFADYHRTMAFVNAVAWIAHVEDHHPDLAVSYGACTVRFNTHSVGGISINDFICAAKVDALFATA
jgi:4a-hydroxytetrahydrobiopterin dehydratase